MEKYAGSTSTNREFIAHDPNIEGVSDSGDITVKIEPFEDDSQEVSASSKGEKMPEEEIYVEDGLNMDLYPVEDSSRNKRFRDPGERIQRHEDLCEVTSSPEAAPESGMENPCSVTDYCSVKMEVHSTDGEDAEEDPINEYGERGRMRVDSPSSCNGESSPNILGSGGLLRPSLDGESNLEDGYGWSNNVDFDGRGTEEEQTGEGVGVVDYRCFKEEQMDSVIGMNDTAGNEEDYDGVTERRIGLGRRRRRRNDEDSKGSRKKQVFSCEKCNYTTDRKWSLNRHAFIHDTHKPKPYKCTECNYRTNYKGSLATHLLIHAGSFKYKDSRGSNTRSKESSEFHESSEKSLGCSEGSLDCTVELPGSVGSLTRREGSEGTPEVPKESSEGRTCHQCGNRTYLTRPLESGTTEKDSDVAFKCSSCSDESNSPSKLKEHYSGDIEEKVYHCPSCSFKTNTEENLSTHSIVHKEVKSYKCSFPSCTYTTNRRDVLTRHALVHNDVKLFKCQWFSCPYETNVKSDLKIHSLKHIIGGAKLFKCVDCSYETNKRSNLNSHRANRHEVDKKFKCSHCPFHTGDKNLFSVHVRTEHQDKVLKCSTCTYEAYDRHVFEFHLLKHSATKLFKCLECHYQTNYKSALKRHMKIHS